MRVRGIACMRMQHDVLRLGPVTHSLQVGTVVGDMRRHPWQHATIMVGALVSAV